MKQRFRNLLKTNRWLKYVPNSLTLCNSLCGFLAILITLRAYERGMDRLDVFFWSAVIICCAMIFDSLDGLAARIFNAASMHGLQMDSLADMVTFGVAPATLVAVMTHSLRTPNHIGRTEEMHLAGTQTSADGEKQRTDVGSLFVIPDAPDFIKDILLLDGVGDGVRQGYLRSRARDAVGNLFAEDFFGFIARQPLFFDGRRSGLCGSNIGGRFGRSLSGCGLSGSLIRRSGRFGRGFDRSVFRGSGLCRLFLSGRSLGGRGFRRRDGTFPAGAFGSGLRIGLCAHDGVGRRQFRLADPQRHMRGLLAPLLNHFGIGY